MSRRRSPGPNRECSCGHGQHWHRWGDGKCRVTPCECLEFRHEPPFKKTADDEWITTFRMHKSMGEGPSG